MEPRHKKTARKAPKAPAEASTEILSDKKAHSTTRPPSSTPMVRSSNITDTQLAYFVKLAELGNFTLTGKFFSNSPGAVHAFTRYIEKALNSKLITVSPNTIPGLPVEQQPPRVQLTEFGKYILPHCKKVLDVKTEFYMAVLKYKQRSSKA